MTMIRRFVTTGPTIQAQYTFIGSIGPQIQMPLEYASFQIEKGQVELAIETLEQGRAFLRAAMRDLCTSVDRLHNVNPTLADRFLAANRAVEGVITSILPHENAEGHLCVAGSHREVDAFSHTLREHRQQERQEIISQIQALPGFQTFLKATPYETHSPYRTSFISSPSYFYERANMLATGLLDTRRNHRLESKAYDRALRCVLEKSHKLVGQAVIPLHAMGPIRSKNMEKLYFSDLYVCSYTPSLGALIAARTTANDSQISCLSPSLLIVGQPDAKFQGVGEEVEVMRTVSIPMTGLVLEKAT